MPPIIEVNIIVKHFEVIRDQLKVNNMVQRAWFIFMQLEIGSGRIGIDEKDDSSSRNRQNLEDHLSVYLC